MQLLTSKSAKAKKSSAKKPSLTRSRTRAAAPRSRASSRPSNKGRYVTIYLAPSLAARYEDQAALFNTTIGKLIKEQVEAKPLSFYDKMKKFIGSAEGLPSDLSTNPIHFEDFGKDSLPQTKPPTLIKKIKKNKK